MFAKLIVSVNSRDGTSFPSSYKRYLPLSTFRFPPVLATENDAVQESLAESFEAMTLFEEALIQYDELEASFFQNLKGVLFFEDPTTTLHGKDSGA